MKFYVICRKDKYGREEYNIAEDPFDWKPFLSTDCLWNTKAIAERYAREIKGGYVREITGEFTS
jgi:hypothetical protein